MPHRNATHAKLALTLLKSCPRLRSRLYCILRPYLRNRHSLPPYCRIKSTSTVTFTALSATESIVTLISNSTQTSFGPSLPPPPLLQSPSSATILVLNTQYLCQNRQLRPFKLGMVIISVTLHNQLQYCRSLVLDSVNSSTLSLVPISATVFVVLILSRSLHV